MIYNVVQGFLERVGQSAIDFVRDLGKITIFVSQVILVFFSKRFYFKVFIKQVIEIGYYSLPVIGLTAIFTGAVLALQSYTGFSRMNAESAVASIVVLSITRELGPVLAGLMLAGRVGAAIAAEVGTMKVTEQIDALYTLNTNPFSYLFVPRVLAGTLMLPLLVLVADIIGVLGGYLISTYKLGFNPYVYLKKTFDYLEVSDVTSGLIKASVFGFIVCVIGCFSGDNCQGGAQGVGSSTTSAVVLSSIFVLLLNYFITGLLFGS